jgi:urease accessory protein
LSPDGNAGPGPARLLRLVQLCDSALPVGAYSHSWGLEAAVARGQVTGPVELEAWARAWLEHAVAPGDGLIVPHAARAAAAEDWGGLADLNDLLTANKVAPTLRRAGLKQGEALLGLAAGWPWSGRVAAELRATGPGPWHHPVVFGALAVAAGATPAEALALLLQNAAAGLIGAAVRSVPIGHTHGQQVAARLHDQITGLADRWADVPLDRFGGLSPAYEVLAHAQTQLYARIFQS